MRDFSCSPKEMAASFWRNRELIRVLTLREALGRYRGSFFGILWPFFIPLLMLIIYTFVFSEVFKTRWSAGSSSKTEFALVLFLGLMAFNIFSECINRAPTLILSNVNYVKKVIFPLEVLPITILASAIYHGAISLGVWFAAYFYLFGLPHATIFYLPLVVVPFFIFTMGVSFVLASLGVYLKDLSQFISIFTAALMFLSPIFYPVSALPIEYRYLIYINPLTPIIEQVRNVLFWGVRPDFMILGYYWLMAVFIAWLGFFFFQKTRKGFADVL